ncbi:MAG: phosphatidylglycerophosphatase A, partial [Bacteroidota bacterium]|nr:phosphatidylglycerophosphatase A [Bacteroidota bacterium]
NFFRRQTMEQNNTATLAKNHKPSFFVKIIGSGFFSGYSPFASGTVGSVVGLLFFLIPNFHLPIIIIPVTVALFVAGGFAAGKMESIYGQDPSVVTVDEIVGMWISLWFIPLTWVNVALAFLIFRILDILKPYPAQMFDSKPGGWNIMLDDVVAAMYTNIIIQVSLKYFQSIHL